MTTWAAYFDSARNDSPLYRVQAALYVEALTAAVGVHAGQRVLDFGCGFGLIAALLAPRVGEVWLWDQSPTMCAVAQRTTAPFANVLFCELSARAPVGRQPCSASMDLILVNSVAQYMPAAELSQWLVRWRELLAPGGKLVLSDLIPPGYRGLADVADLVRLGIRHGSPLSATSKALGGVLHYWRMRQAVPLTRIDDAELGHRAAQASLDLVVLPRNLTHFSRRWTAVLSRLTDGP